MVRRSNNVTMLMTVVFVLKEPSQPSKRPTNELSLRALILLPSHGLLLLLLLPQNLQRLYLADLHLVHLLLGHVQPSNLLAEHVLRHILHLRRLGHLRLDQRELLQLRRVLVHASDLKVDRRPHQLQIHARNHASHSLQHGRYP